MGGNFHHCCASLHLRRWWKGLIPPGFYLFSYLDDFLIVGNDVRQLVEVTQTVVSALTRAGFVVSGKSTLQPVQRIFFGGEVGGLCS